MLGKRPRPMIGKLSELLVPRGRIVGLSDTTAGSPRGPLDMKMQSPRGLKSYDRAGVGLGIVVALDKSSDRGREVLPKHAICTSNLNRSGPIPVHCAKNPHEIDVEEYTYVTCRVPDRRFTKLYYDGCCSNNNNNNNNNVGVLKRSTPQLQLESWYPTSNFLSSCHLCGKKLEGRDIYMYRGEKAFCSTECRSSQIMMDERKERCSSEASRSVELSNSREQIFSTGILAL
ncbi:hypothetical protein Fmac_013251 [Flemingia macrophylla]|uniref:FLZ-type domain-containing protein n=1 Tax=Flemingia macrophylla TaxID=520843 RepID=A0ABD1MSM4_9FABA